MKDSYNQILKWINRNTSWLILLGAMILVSVTLIANANKDYLEGEREKCSNLVIGEAMKKSYLGECELCLGSDNKTHYVYHRYYYVNDNEDEYIYINWKTGKGGKY